MRVEELMTRSVRTIGLDRKLDEAAELMRKTDCGSLPVVDEQGELVGMLTDRDICMHALSKAKPLGDLDVRDAQSAELVVCRETDAVTHAEGLMQAYKVRRLPVVDEEGRLIGVFSLSDLAREAVVQRDAIHPDVADDGVVQTLVAVTQPRDRTASRGKGAAFA